MTNQKPLPNPTFKHMDRNGLRPHVLKSIPEDRILGYAELTQHQRANLNKTPCLRDAGTFWFELFRVDPPVAGPVMSQVEEG